MNTEGPAPAETTRRRWRWCAHALVVAGLVVLAWSVPLPFASNEAGGSDHYAPADRYYVWAPYDNFGMPFLVIGILLCVTAWLAARWRRAIAVLVTGSLSGWFGLYVLYAFAPFWVETTSLYGGPELELRPSRWVVGYGWALLWAGAIVSVVTAALAGPGTSTPPAPSTPSTPSTPADGASGD